MKYILSILLLCSLFAQGQNSDWIELQSKIDTAIKYGSTVRVDRNYTIDKPLIAANWDGKRYSQVYFRMKGEGSMWDKGQSSVIRATFTDAPVFSIQVGKGVIIEGITFMGGGWGRDSRYSPQAAVCIDPFSGNLPPDGGYPTLTEWYKGANVRNGSTGIRFEDCTFSNATVGVITSPNGHTQNADILTFQNIRIQNVKYGFVGCQAQEKGNTIINLGAWGKTQCVFVFNRYGAAQPGNWIIDRVNIAGDVDSIIYRYSAGWGAMFLSNVFAENILSVGMWGAGSGDVFEKSLINLKFPYELGFFPENSMDADGLILNNVNIRYYGMKQTPMVIVKSGAITGGSFYTPPITTKYGWQSHNSYEITKNFWPSNDTVVNNKATLTLRSPGVNVGDHVLFMQVKDWAFLGQGEVESINGNSVTIRYITPSVKYLKDYQVGIYKRK